MEQVKSNRGFASMDRARQREIASKGGHGVPPEKRSFSKNRQLAAEAGRKGGEHSHKGQQHEQSNPSERGQHGSGNFADDRQRASEAGKKGGQH